MGRPTQSSPPDGKPMRVTGRVVRFDAAKGVGFVWSNELDGDILLHRDVLDGDGHASDALKPDALVVCDVVRKAKGLHVVRVISIHEGTA